MSKTILIAGAGLGKTMIGDLLAEKYEREGSTCERIFVTCPADIMEIDESTADFVVVESNYVIGNIEVWQEITISGGMPVEEGRVDE